METICVLDIETTGMNSTMAKVVEIAAVIVRNGKITERFQSLVWPGDEAFRTSDSRRALEVQWRTIEDFKGAPLFSPVSWKFGEFVEDLPLTAFNVKFERSFLDMGWGATGHQWPYCIMLKSSEIMGKAKSPYCPWLGYYRDYKWPKLHEAAEFFRVSPERGITHEALADAETAAYILIGIAKREKDEEEKREESG